MKVWLFYITLPEDMSKYSAPEVDMFSSVSQVIISKLEQNVSTNRYSTLYAYTNDKEKADMFEEIHDMTLFVKIKHKMSDAEYDLLAKGYESYHKLELEWETHPMDKGYVQYPLTTFENTILSDVGVEDIEEFIGSVCNINYEIFKPKYIKALDMLLYTYNHKMLCGDDEEMEYLSNLWSYGMSPEGNIKQGSESYNMLNLYRKYFALILRKEWKL